MNVKSKYQMDISNFKTINPIGKGAFSEVYLVQNKNTNEQLAAKINSNNIGLSAEHQKQAITREISILIKIQHPTIVQFKGYSFQDFSKKENTVIFMEYLQNKSLSAFIKKEQDFACPDQYNNTKRQMILAGVAKGMMVLHSHRVIHRDLKADNILLDIDLKPKITDFGLSKFFDPTNSQSNSKSACGTISYMAPEVIQSNNYNTKADVYSFGILMYEVVTGKIAYSDLIKQKDFNSFTLMKMVTNGYRPIFPFPIKKSLQDLIEKCWSQDYHDRPTFLEIYRKLSLSHEEFFFENEIFDISNENEDEMKYCLEGVDYDEFFDYINEINVENNSSIYDILYLNQKIASLEKENQNLKVKIDEINQNHKNEINDMQQQVNDLTEYVHQIESGLKVKSSSVPTPIFSITGCVVKATGIQSPDLTKPDSYVLLSLINKDGKVYGKVKTQIQYQTHDPVWEEPFDFASVQSEDVIKAEIFHVSKILSDQCVAFVNIPISSLKENKSIVKEYVLERSPAMSNFMKKGMKFGNLTLFLSYKVMNDEPKE